jgi:hypothetical protein
MGVGVEDFGRETQTIDMGASLFQEFLLAGDAIMRFNDILEGLDDLAYRIENTHGSLHYIRNFLPAYGTSQFLFRSVQHVNRVGFKLVLNASRNNFQGRFDIARDYLDQGCFATARLTSYPINLIWEQFKRNSVNGPYCPGNTVKLSLVIRAEVFYV